MDSRPAQAPVIIDLTGPDPADPTGRPRDEASPGPDPADGSFEVCPQAFADLYALHYDAVLAQSRRMARRPDEAEDIAQDAFVRALAGAARTGIADPSAPWGPAHSGTYLRKVVANLGMDRWRAAQRRPDPVALDAVPVEALGVEQPEDPVVREETCAQVRAGMRLILPQHRDALVLREVHELDAAEVAGRLGIDRDNVKHVLNRARRSLRRVLAGTFADAA